MTDADKIQKLKAHETDLLEQRFKLETRQEEIESALSILNARLEEVRGALELFDDIDRARAATAKAKATKPEPEKPLREVCADQIDKLYPTDLPLTWDACDFSLVDNFNGRTGRAALNLVHERRRKAAIVQSGTIPQPTSGTILAASTESAAKHAESPRRSTALSPKVPERVEVNGSPPAADPSPSASEPETDPLEIPAALRRTRENAA